jgi:hypothetical protein
VAGVFACTVILILRIRGGVCWWSAFSVLVLGGVAAGLLVSLGERQDSPTRRVVGWPFPAAIFKLEHGNWVDYVTPAPIAIGVIALDTGVIASGALLPLIGAAWFYTWHRAGAGKESPNKIAGPNERERDQPH